MVDDAGGSLRALVVEVCSDLCASPTLLEKTAGISHSFFCLLIYRLGFQPDASNLCHS